VITIPNLGNADAMLRSVIDYADPNESTCSVGSRERAFVREHCAGQRRGPQYRGSSSAVGEVEHAANASRRIDRGGVGGGAKIPESPVPPTDSGCTAASNIADDLADVVDANSVSSECLSVRGEGQDTQATAYPQRRLFGPAKPPNPPNHPSQVIHCERVSEK
jgi:hypothetical protein